MSGLHDARLVRVTFTSDPAVAEVHLDIGGPDAFIIVATDLQDVRFSRADPWGPSAFVDHAQVTTNTLAIELQSGDTIHVQAGSFDPPSDQWPNVDDPSRLPLKS